jgi:hypothetical protein
MMRALALALTVLALGAGCRTSPVSGGGDGAASSPDGGGARSDGGLDGGGVSCESLTAADCRSYAGCALFPGCCNGPSFCAPAGTQYECPTCPACLKLDEPACIAASAAGCHPSYCPDCKGGKWFTGCAVPGDNLVCPAICPPQ